MQLTPAPDGPPLVVPMYMPVFLQVRVPVGSPHSSHSGAQVVQLWSNLPEEPQPAHTLPAQLRQQGVQPWEVPVTIQPCDVPMHG
jgi:hypothetical protein